MELRLIAAAMLFHENDLLMMKRPMHRTLSPGMWTVIGGHMEQHELSAPKEACLREIEEETGLKADELSDLSLQYILLRMFGGEIRQQFIYVGTAARRDVSDCDEGELHWIPCEQVPDKEMSYIFQATVEHYWRNGPSDTVWVGTSGLDTEGRPTVQWVTFVDYGVL